MSAISQTPAAPPSTGSGGRATRVIGLVVLAVVMIGGLLALGGGELGRARPRALPGEYTAGPVTLTDVEVRENSGDDFIVLARASASFDDDSRALNAYLEVDILNDEQVVATGSAPLWFAGPGHRIDALFLFFEEYDADFDKVIFREVTFPPAEHLLNVRRVEGTFTSGDFTLTDVDVGEDVAGDLAVRGTITYGGAQTVEASLAVVVDGPAGTLGRASMTAEPFEPGESQTRYFPFINSPDYTDEQLELAFEATVEEAAGRASAAE